MKNSFRLIQFLFIACLTTTAFADVKIKTRQTMQGQTYENTTYIKGKRQRSEQNNAGMQMVHLTQCDLRRDIQMMPASKTYMITMFDETANSTAKSDNSASGNQQSAIEKGGTITTTVTNKDTGERKQMFGYTARHIITTMITESSPDACTPMKSKMEIDGWYIDAAFALECELNRYSGYKNYNKKSGCEDKHNMKTIGAAKTGYPVYTKTTMFDENGKETYTYVNEVIELSNATLDASLFDVPADYREVKTSAELYASMSSSSSTTNVSSQNSSASSTSGINNTDEPANQNSGINQNVQNMANKTANISTEVGAKKSGVVRLGLAAVKTGKVGEGMNATELAAAIQNTLTEYLKAPRIELVQIEAKLPSAIDAEAKQKECDFVIYATVSHKKGGGFGKMLGGLSSVVSRVGYGSSNVAGQVASVTIQSAAAMSGNIKSKDEITLEYKLTPAGDATPAVANTLKAKATSDGENIISPLIEQAAQTIVNAANKK